MGIFQGGYIWHTPYIPQLGEGSGSQSLEVKLAEDGRMGNLQYETTTNSLLTLPGWWPTAVAKDTQVVHMWLNLNECTASYSPLTNNCTHHLPMQLRTYVGMYLGEMPMQWLSLVTFLVALIFLHSIQLARWLFVTIKTPSVMRLSKGVCRAGCPTNPQSIVQYTQ